MIESWRAPNKLGINRGQTTINQYVRHPADRRRAGLCPRAC